MKKGSWVKLNNQVCFVTKGGTNPKLAHYIDDVEGKKGIYIYSNVPLVGPKSPIVLAETPEDVAHPELIRYVNDLNASCKKGEYMSCLDADDVRQYGVIIKGGKNKVEMNVAGTDRILVASARAFRAEGAAPAIEIPKELADWSFTSYARHDGLSEETIAFSATVKYKGKKELAVRNGGHGGSMEAHSVGAGKRMQSLLIQHVKASIERIFPDKNNRPDYGEMDEAYIHWFNFERGLLVTWEEHAKGFIFNPENFSCN